MFGEELAHEIGDGPTRLLSIRAQRVLLVACQA